MLVVSGDESWNDTEILLVSYICHETSGSMHLYGKYVIGKKRFLHILPYKVTKILLESNNLFCQVLLLNL